MSKGRRRHTAEQKAELLRQHVAEKKPVSEVCNEAEIQPSLFYTWQRELLAGAHTVFSFRRAPSREKELVPWTFDYYTKLGFSPAHKIHKIHALRMVSASSALSSLF